jgi:protocatechuate 3,4-dioxygenase, alpha subunit
MTVGLTPSQTAGPYFSMALAQPGENLLVGPEDDSRIRIEGFVYDGEGNHVEDALLEIWQADAKGNYRHPDDAGPKAADGFRGFGRALSDFETGRYFFETVKPGPVPDPEGELQAPHIAVVVQGRGILNPYFTRIYFADEADANQHDLVLGMVPRDRRSTLIARPVENTIPPCYRFDIRLQGEGETVFFDF